MDEPQSNLHFRLMTLTYKFRDLIHPRMEILKEAGIKPGYSVVDYGCGPGSYILPLVGLVGNTGRVYAVDIHPLAIESVKKLIARNHLINVEPILSDCDTKIPDSSIHVILLYDILHDLDDPENVLTELTRILKHDGKLSLCDHHMNEEEILSHKPLSKLFTLEKKGTRTYTFVPKEED